MKRIALALLPVLTVLACGDTRPCNGTNCPPLAGTYAMAWTRGSQNGCTGTGPQPATLTFSLTGNVAKTAVGGETLLGTAYDTYDFTVSGGHETTYSMHGRVIPTDPVTDAGVRIIGTLATRRLLDGGSGCEIREDYTGDRISN